MAWATNWTLGVISGENTSASTPANVVRAASYQQTVTATSNLSFHTSTRILRIGAAGRDVEGLSNILIGKGFPVQPPYTVYTASTANAVKQFQQAVGLTVDGVVGPKTKAALLTVNGPLAAPAPVQAPYTPATPQWSQFAAPKEDPSAPVTTSGNEVAPPDKNPLRPVAIGLLVASGVILVGAVLLRR